MRCVVVDDEPLAREGLLDLIGQIEFLECVGSFSNPVELGEFLNQQQVDLIFLDIKMPLVSGIEYLRMSPSLPMVILTTAFPNYAIEGYELDVIDYLLKPISFTRFYKAVQKARKFQSAINGEAENKKDDQEDYLFVKCDQKYEKIWYDEILYVEGMQNYVQIHCAEKKFTTLLFLKNIEKSLPEDQFLRCHKSYIISLAKVDQIDGGEVVIAGSRIPLSRSSKKEIHEKILGNKLLQK